MIVTKESHAYEAKRRTEADTEAGIMRQNAEARHAVAVSKSQALIKEATAEEQSQ